MPPQHFSYLHAMKYCILLLALATTLQSQAQQRITVDVQHYRFELTLSDASDTIMGTAIISTKILQNSTVCTFNLTNIKPNGKGMQVMDVTQQGKPVPFTHSNNILAINRSDRYADLGDADFVIRYKGIPADGLIIAKNQHDQRTFFGDNWPNRAQNWLPCNDVPSDKASVEFIVTAPDHYTVVANGIKQSETAQPNNTKTTHWKEEVLLPTKVMVIGAADFAVEQSGTVAGIPVFSYVYQQEKTAGFYDYAMANEVLPFYINYIGSYAYKKLANVQSKTIFGGMENANTIFYFEGSVTGKRLHEDLIAHEMVHQWFGNMVTETAFNHLWLSEGFATYLTNVYLEQKYGADSLANRLREERQQVIDFAMESNKPVLDTTNNYMSLLNANSYQKGGWILHMLRRTIGDSAFQKTIKEYYRLYAGKNASSADFQKVAEYVSGKKLGIFFTQWLQQPGMPVLDIRWQYNAAKKTVTGTITQQQEKLFTFPLELGINSGSKTTVKTVAVSKRKTVFSFPSATAVQVVQPDPRTNLLWMPPLAKE